MEQKKLKDLKQGELFRIYGMDTGLVYIRGEYDRTQRKYECSLFDDIGRCRYFKGDKLVYVGFTF